MNAVMTMLAVFLAVSAISVPARADAPAALQGAWLAEDIRSGGVLDRVQSRIEIAEDGAVAGSGGCNRIAGKAAIDGDRISFGSLISTEMACAPAIMDQEQKFLRALEDAKGWKTDPERRKLILLSDEGNPLVTFARD